MRKPWNRKHNGVERWGEEGETYGRIGTERWEKG